MLYNVHTLDVWGNSADGYEVNDVYGSVGSIELNKHTSDTEIFQSLTEAGIVDYGEAALFSVTGAMPYSLFAYYDGEPVFDLRPANEGKTNA